MGRKRIEEDRNSWLLILYFSVFKCECVNYFVLWKRTGITYHAHFVLCLLLAIGLIFILFHWQDTTWLESCWKTISFTTRVEHQKLCTYCCDHQSSQYYFIFLAVCREHFRRYIVVHDNMHFSFQNLVTADWDSITTM